MRREFMVFEELVKNERNEAKEEGIAEGKIEVAKNLLQMGTLSIENISSATSLSIEEIQELAKSNK